MSRDPPAEFPPSAPASPRPLGAARTLETIEAGFEWMAELSRALAVSQARVDERRRQLRGQGDFLVGAVRAAAGEFPATTTEGLRPLGEGLDNYRRSAEQRLSLALSELDQQAAAESAALSAELLAARQAVAARVQRFRAAAPPSLSLTVRLMGAQRILHFARVTSDDAVLLLAVLTGSIPLRYDFLFDDSTEDANLEPPSIYPGAGLPVRPRPSELRILLEERRDVLPVKGVIPVLLPSGALFRLRQRGPVLEAELANGDAYRSLLTTTEAEQLAGHLVRLNLEGQVRLEVQL